MHMNGHDSLTEHPLHQWEIILLDFSTLYFNALTKLNDFRKESVAQQKGSGSLISYIRPSAKKLEMTLFADEDMSQLTEVSKMEKVISNLNTSRPAHFRRAPFRRFGANKQTYRPYGDNRNFQSRFSGSRGGKGGAKRSFPPPNKQN